MNLNFKNNMGSKWIYGLDSLRFILALWVLIGHLGFPFLPAVMVGDSIIWEFLVLFLNNLFVGVAAVIAFFIISGIVIHFPHINGNLSPTEFIIKRYTRIIIPMSGIYFIALITNNMEATWPFWSLYCELFYYTLYPLLFKLSKYLCWKHIFIVSLFLCLMSIFFFSNAFIHLFNVENNKYHGNYHSLGVFFTSIIGLPVWLLGVIIAESVSKGEIIYVNPKKIILLRLFILFLSVLASISRFHFGVSYMISLTFFSLPIAYWIYCEIKVINKNKFYDLLEFAGKWSYSLYICHSLVIIILSDVGHINLGIGAWLIKFFLSLLLSYLFFILVERPSHKLAKKIKFRKI